VLYAVLCLSQEGVVIKMRVIDVFSLAPVSMPGHHNAFSRRLWGPESGSKQMAIGYNFLFAQGGAEEHKHDSEHVFIILKGSCNFKVNSVLYNLREGQAIVVEPGEMHQMTGNGHEDCWYVTITSPPAWKS
jgi:quercetin dioxygenase-like cupin family protein